MGIRLDVAAATVLSLTIGAGVGWWQSTLDEQYAANAVLVVNPAPTTLAATGTRPENAVFLARTYAARFETRPTLTTAAAEAGLPLSFQEARDRTSVAVSTTDATITVTTTGPSRTDARALNSALTEVVADQVDDEQAALRSARLQPLDAQIADLQSRLRRLDRNTPEQAAVEAQFRTLLTIRANTELAAADRLDTLSPSTAAEEPVAPHPTRSGLLAFLVAAAVSAQLAAWREYRRRNRRSAAPAAAYPQPVVAAPAAAEDAPEVESAIERMKAPGARRRTAVARQRVAAGTPGLPDGP